MGEELDKRYDPKAFEERWYRFWEEGGFFTARPGSGQGRFSIVIPPPNVTGTLHMGHAFEDSLSDCIVRWKRMRGLDTLWLPGMDHAGIMTQVVVEKELAKEGKTRHDLGREAFVERVWKWKEESGGGILRQLRRLGASLDWSRERFTMDEEHSHAVREVFVRLYEEGLIYRGEFIVNWCPRCRTALSDLEAADTSRKGHLWHIRYPLADGGGHLTVATTRPETMLGDTGVAVHPEDERYRAFVGKKLRLPLTEREIPVVADSFVEREFGTGAVKITPAHDASDFEAAKRCGLPSLCVMNQDGRMNEAAGREFSGLDRFEARRKAVAMLEAQGLLEKTEDYSGIVKTCGRCDTVIEPYLSMQWFVKTKPLAEEAVRAVEDGRTVFVPERWAKVYFDWMRNIHDWCISRQLWWGHPIPAWHCSCGGITVAREAPSTCGKCGGDALTPDPDVLDTWFSSALWPFSTMGWPEKTEDFKRYYPTDVIMPGFDIIFFWVARMMMMGLKFTGEVPFRAVAIHGLVRDAKGQKMSKSRGNTVDPLEYIDKYGADSLRFTFLAMATPGADVPLNEKRVEGYRAFCTKLWNAARFAMMNLGADARPAHPGSAGSLADRWILSRLSAITAEVNAALEQYRFDQAAHLIYHFLWDEFCDWYLEMSKPALQGTDEAAKRAAQNTLLLVLDRVLRLLHPFMPFITEELWQKLPASVRDAQSLCIARWPEAEEAWRDAEAESHMQVFMETVSACRRLRSTFQMAPGKALAFLIECDERSWRMLGVNGVSSVYGRDSIFGRLINGSASNEYPRGRYVSEITSGHMTVRMEIPPDFDAAAQRQRLEKEKTSLLKEREGLEKRLANPGFVQKAEPAVVEETRVRAGEITGLLGRLERLIGELAALG